MQTAYLLIELESYVHDVRGARVRLVDVSIYSEPCPTVLHAERKHWVVAAQESGSSYAQALENLRRRIDTDPRLVWARPYLGV